MKENSTIVDNECCGNISLQTNTSGLLQIVCVYFCIYLFVEVVRMALCMSGHCHKGV